MNVNVDLAIEWIMTNRSELTFGATARYYQLASPDAGTLEEFKQESSQSLAVIGAFNFGEVWFRQPMPGRSEFWVGDKKSGRGNYMVTFSWLHSPLGELIVKLQAVNDSAKDALAAADTAMSESCANYLATVIERTDGLLAGLKTIETSKAMGLA